MSRLVTPTLAMSNVIREASEKMAMYKKLGLNGDHIDHHESVQRGDRF